jgi:hypothetical protein
MDKRVTTTNFTNLLFAKPDLLTFRQVNFADVNLDRDRVRHQAGPGYVCIGDGWFQEDELQHVRRFALQRTVVSKGDASEETRMDVDVAVTCTKLKV